MNVMFVSDDNYTEPLIITLNSLFINNPVIIHVFLVSNGLKKKNLERIENFIKKNNGILHYFKCDLNIDGNKMQNQVWGPIVYQRIYGMFHIKEERILYLDCDLIVDSNLEELYTMDLKGFYAAAVKDSGMDQMFLDCESHMKKLMLESKEDYFNSGVLLLNLKKIQADFTLQFLLEKIEKYAEIFVFPDQDLLNMVWNKKVKFVDPKYNRIATDYAYRKYIKADTQIAIYHYTGYKPWNQWDRSGRKGYQWYVLKYMQYSNIPETKETYELTKKYNSKPKDIILSKIKEKRGYNPAGCIKKNSWKTFWDYIFFYV